MNFSTVNYGKDTGLKSDESDFDGKNSAALKYYTTRSSGPLPLDLGISFHDGFGTSIANVDKETDLIRSTITNPKVRQNFGFLPTQGGGLASNGPVISESNSRQNKSCQPLSNDHYKRHFYELPGYSIKTEENRQGSDTRQTGRS
jgi:hypothetical protein